MNGFMQLCGTSVSPVLGVTGIPMLAGHGGPALQALIWRIGWTLVHFLWEGFAVAALAAIILFLLRRRSAGSRYIVACTSLALMLGAFVTTLLVVQSPPEIVPRDLPVVFTSKADARPAVLTASFEVESSRPLIVASQEPKRILQLNIVPAPSWRQRMAALLAPRLPWIVAVWLIGCVALSLRLFGGWLQVQRIRRRYVQPVEARCEALLIDLRDRLRVSRPVRLLASQIAHVPMAIGWVRPVILLPISVMTGLDEDQLRAILAHELAHIRRYDYLVNILQSAIEVLLFYHPAVWWLSRRIRAERENCCDDLAVACCGDKLLYARALTTLEELRGAPQLAAAASGGRLLNRIRRIMGISARPAEPPWHRPAGALALILILAISACVHMRAVRANLEPNSQTSNDIRAGATAATQQAFHGMNWQIKKADGVVAEAMTVLPQIADLGADTVLISNPGYQKNAGSESFKIDPTVTPSDEQWQQIFTLAHEKGLRVILEPVVLLSDPRGTEWRGVISPPNWDNWFAEYTEFILRFAKLAEKNRVEVFCIGAELVSTERYDGRWRQVIREVRKVYSGKLTYSANWDHYKVIQFWNDVDYVGMTSFYKLSNEPNPSMEALLDAWKPIKQGLLQWQKDIGKPLLFTEVGWCSQEGASIEPWNYFHQKTPSQKGLEEQRRCYRSFMDSWANTPQVGGAIWWEWVNNPGGPSDITYLPRGKPAEQELREWFKTHGRVATSQPSQAANAPVWGAAWGESVLGFKLRIRDDLSRFLPDGELDLVVEASNQSSSYMQLMYPPQVEVDGHWYQPASRDSHIVSFFALIWSRKLAPGEVQDDLRLRLKAHPTKSDKLIEWVDEQDRPLELAPGPHALRVKAPLLASTFQPHANDALSNVVILDQSFDDSTQNKPSAGAGEDKRITLGDRLSLRMLDFVARDVESEFTPTVDDLGYIVLPQLGWIHVEGMATSELRDNLIVRAKNGNIFAQNSEPTVVVTITAHAVGNPTAAPATQPASAIDGDTAKLSLRGSLVISARDGKLHFLINGEDTVIDVVDRKVRLTVDQSSNSAVLTARSVELKLVAPDGNELTSTLDAPDGRLRISDSAGRKLIEVRGNRVFMHGDKQTWEFERQEINTNRPASQPAAAIQTRPATAVEIAAELQDYRNEEKRLETQLEALLEEKKRLMAEQISTPGITENINVIGETHRAIAPAVITLEQDVLQSQALDESLRGVDPSQVVLSPEMMMMIQQDPRVSSLQQSKTQLEQERTTAVKQFGPTHRTVKLLQTQIDAIDQDLQKAMQQKEKEVREYQIYSAHTHYLNALQAKLKLQERQMEQEAKQRALDQAKVGLQIIENQELVATNKLNQIQQYATQLQLMLKERDTRSEARSSGESPSSRPTSAQEAAAEELQDYRNEEKRLEGELEALFKEKNQLLADQLSKIGASAAGAEKLKSLTTGLDRLKQETWEARLAYERLSNQDPSKIELSPEARMMIQQDPRLNSLQNNRTQLEQQRTIYLQQFGPKHRTVRLLQTEIDAIDHDLQNAIQVKQKEVSDNQIDAAKTRYLNLAKAELHLQEQLNEEAKQQAIELNLPPFKEHEARQQALRKQLAQLRQYTNQLQLMMKDRGIRSDSGPSSDSPSAQPAAATQPAARLAQTRPAGAPMVRVIFDPAAEKGFTGGTRLVPQKFGDIGGFMAMMEYQIGGRFPINAENGNKLFDIKLLDGDDDRLEIEVTGKDYHEKLTLVRDKSVNITIAGVTYSLTYPSQDTQSDQPVRRNSAPIFVTQIPQMRRFVRIVVDKDKMTFEGEPVTWDDLPARLEKVPDRKQTVLEIAIATSDMSVREAEEAKSRGWDLASRLGFEYGSYIGEHPLGSKGSPSQSLAPVATQTATEQTPGSAAQAARDQRVLVYALKNAAAQEVVPIIKKTLSDAQGVQQVVADERTNSLVVSGTAAGLERVTDLLMKLDHKVIEERTVRVVHLKYVNAQKVVEKISSLYPPNKGLRRAVTVTDSGESQNSVLLSYHPSLEKELMEVIDELEVEAAPPGMPQSQPQSDSTGIGRETGAAATSRPADVAAKTVVATLPEKSPAITIETRVFEFKNLEKAELWRQLLARTGQTGQKPFSMGSADLEWLLAKAGRDSTLAPIEAPRLQVLDGREATIAIGGENAFELPIVENNWRIGIALIFQGTHLGFVGHIRPDRKTVSLSIDARVSRLDLNAKPPTELAGEFNATQEIQNGQTLVIRLANAASRIVGAQRRPGKAGNKTPEFDPVREPMETAKSPPVFILLIKPTIISATNGDKQASRDHPKETATESGAAAATRPFGVPGPRVLHLPADRTVGAVQITPWDKEPQGFMDWKSLGEARGDVQIPAGMQVMLAVNETKPQKLPDGHFAIAIQSHDVTNYSFLSTLSAGDLDWLDLGNTKLKDEDLANIEKLKGLRHLRLDSTPITNAGLQHLKPLTSLEFLSLFNCDITDAGLETIGQLSSLRQLQLYRCSGIKGPGLVHLKQLRHLGSLDISDTAITDDSLAPLAALRDLKELRMYDTDISDAGLQIISRIKSIEGLWLGRIYPRNDGKLRPRTNLASDDAPITDAGLALVATLPKLNYLALYHARISDDGLRQLAVLRHLENLDLMGSPITDKAAPFLSTLKTLKFLGMRETKLTPAGVDTLRKALPHCEVQFSPPSKADSSRSLKPTIAESASNTQQQAASQPASGIRTIMTMIVESGLNAPATQATSKADAESSGRVRYATVEEITRKIDEHFKSRSAELGEDPPMDRTITHHPPSSRRFAADKR